MFWGFDFKDIDLKKVLSNCMKVGFVKIIRFVISGNFVVNGFYFIVLYIDVRFGGNWELIINLLGFLL